MKLPKNFLIKAATPRVWQIIENFFNENNIKWCDGESISQFGKYGKENVIHFRDKALTYADTDFYKSSVAPYISLEELLCGEFEKEAVKFQLNAEYTAEIVEGKVICGSYTIDFDTIRAIAAQIRNPLKPPAKFAVKTPNQRIYDLVNQQMKTLTGESLNTKFGQVYNYTASELYISSEISYCNYAFYVEKGFKILTLEQLFSIEPQPVIEIGPYKLRIEENQVRAGCQTIPNDKILELEALLK